MVASFMGKVLGILLSAWPFLTHVGNYITSKNSRTNPISDSLGSYPTLLIQTLNCAVWVSYSYKVSSVELMTLMVGSLVSNVAMIGVLMVFHPR